MKSQAFGIFVFGIIVVTISGIWDICIWYYYCLAARSAASPLVLLKHGIDHEYFCTKCRKTVSIRKCNRCERYIGYKFDVSDWKYNKCKNDDDLDNHSIVCIDCLNECNGCDKGYCSRHIIKCKNCQQLKCEGCIKEIDELDNAICHQCFNNYQ